MRYQLLFVVNMFQWVCQSMSSITSLVVIIIKHVYNALMKLKQSLRTKAMVLLGLGHILLVSINIWNNELIYIVASKLWLPMQEANICGGVVYQSGSPCDSENRINKLINIPPTIIIVQRLQFVGETWNNLYYMVRLSCIL